MDDAAYRVTRAGRMVDLSPTEYKLLRFLLRNPGRVMTKSQILDHVWDYDFSGESTVVETLRVDPPPEGRLRGAQTHPDRAAGSATA